MKTILCDVKQSPMMPNNLLWCQAISYDTKQSPMMPNNVLWCQTIFYDVKQSPMMPSNILWYQTISYYAYWIILTAVHLFWELSLWKRIKCFLSTLRRRNLKTHQSAVILDSCFRKTVSITWLSWRHCFPKAPFSQCPHQNSKPAFSNSVRFEERFRKRPFSRRNIVDDWPNRRNKAALLHYSRVDCTGPEIEPKYCKNLFVFWY